MVLLSTSMSYDDGIKLDHNNRSSIPPNAHKSLISNNVIIKNLTDKEKTFNDLYADDVANYNASQRRKDRQIDNYYKKVLETRQARDKTLKENEKNNMPKPIEEYVFQFGNMFNNNVNDPAFAKVVDDSKQMLYELHTELERRYPSIKFVGAYIHMDEQTPHLHEDIIPYPLNPNPREKMKHKCSMSAALKELGFVDKTEFITDKDGRSIPHTITAREQWQAEIKTVVMPEILHRHGYEREDMDNHESHLSTTKFKSKTVAISQQKKQQLSEEIKRLDLEKQTQEFILKMMESDAAKLNEEVNDYDDLIDYKSELNAELDTQIKEKEKQISNLDNDLINVAKERAKVSEQYKKKFSQMFRSDIKENEIDDSKNDVSKQISVRKGFKSR